jgi:hypothetical protein
MTVPPARWVPERSGPAVVMCVRGSSSGNPSQILDWGTAEDAALADRLLYAAPCDTGCEGSHVRVWAEPGKLHVAKSVHEPPPPSRAEAFAECYPPRLVNGRPVLADGTPRLSATPALWPTPSIYNEPLPPRGTPMNPETQRAQDAAVAAAAGRKLTPEPGGLNGRAARAHDHAEELKRNGSPVDELIGGADMLASALTNAALCEP